MANRNPHDAPRSDTQRDYVTRSFVIPVDHDVALKALAAKNHRTFSGELRLIVEAHLAANTEALEDAA